MSNKCYQLVYLRLIEFGLQLPGLIAPLKKYSYLYIGTFIHIDINLQRREKEMGIDINVFKGT